MWHTLEHVAENQRLDVEEFKRFALSNRERYHLDSHDMVGTWYVNDLIRDFKYALISNRIKDETIRNDKATKPIPSDIIRKFQDLLIRSSPENLSCDGECPKAVQRQKLVKINLEWLALERRIGREVTEREIEGYHHLIHSSEKLAGIRYKVVTMTHGGMKAEVLNSLDALLAYVRRLGGHQTGVEESMARRVELRGQPIFNNLLGPMYDGPGFVRYEDNASYRALSI